jgi:chorismate synthase
VAAGAIAKQFLSTKGIKIDAWVRQVGEIICKTPYTSLDLGKTEATPVRCPDLETAIEMIKLINEIKKAGDTVGGVVACVIKGCPAGLGEPVFDKLHAELGKAMLSINACKGFEIGSGFAGTLLRGSQHNDAFVKRSGRIRTATNRSGGIQGGISNGEDIDFRIAFKPTATVLRPQTTVEKSGKATEISAKGRHDPCVLPRAVPIVEAMAALVLVDHWMRDRAQNTAFGKCGRTR